MRVRELMKFHLFPIQDLTCTVAAADDHEQYVSSTVLL